MSKAATDNEIRAYDGHAPFTLIEASKLKVDDDFIKNVDAFGKVKIFRDVLTKAIASTSNIKNFYVQTIDPCLNEDGTGISYIEGRMPAINHSFNWARKVAFEYAPHLESRLGTPKEFIFFGGVLIKKLIENGYSVDEAWHMVCADSAKIGNYRNGNNGRAVLMPTGSIKVAGFTDLANTCKYLSENGKCFLASGSYKNRSDYAFVTDITRLFCNDEKNVAVPWVVIPA